MHLNMLPSAFATASAPELYSFAAQWLACDLPCRRFATTLTGNSARLRADVVRYSFIVPDSHRLLLAGLPAHCEKSWTLPIEPLHPGLILEQLTDEPGRTPPEGGDLPESEMPFE